MLIRSRRGSSLTEQADADDPEAVGHPVSGRSPGMTDDLDGGGQGGGAGHGPGEKPGTGPRIEAEESGSRA